MKREVPRITTIGEDGQMFRALVALGFAPRPTRTVEAQLVQPGLGLMSRFTEAVEALQPNQFLLVSGVNPIEKNTWRPTPDVLADLGLGWNEFCQGCLDAAEEDIAKSDNDKDPDGLCRVVAHERKRVHFQGRATHTKAQSIWIATTLRALSIGSCTLHVSGYHGPRAFMTNLAQLQQFGLADHVAMFLASTSDSPANIIPEYGHPMRDAFSGEFDRIKQYGPPRGDVVSWDELYAYLERHWNHPATR